MLKEYGYIQFLTYEKNSLFIYLQIRSIVYNINRKSATVK